MMNWCTWYNGSQTCPYTLQTVAQLDSCTTKFKLVRKSSNCCTKSQTTPHMIKLFVQRPVLSKMFDGVWGPLIYINGKIFQKVSLSALQLTSIQSWRKKTIVFLCFTSEYNTIHVERLQWTRFDIWKLSYMISVILPTYWLVLHINTVFICFYPYQSLWSRMGSHSVLAFHMV
jgi:hypothetical protein